MAATVVVVAVATVAFMAATAAVAQPSLVSEALFNQMLKHRDDSVCNPGFYTYKAFTDAASAFPNFANTGDPDTRKRELAAFFGQTSQETTGGWPTAPDGPYTWGYCFVLENRGNAGDDCQPDPQWGCAPGKKYYGRGPIQLTGNHNYGEAGKALHFDGIQDPDIVGRDATVSFKTALWFWMTPQSPKPSCHDVITGQWTPSAADAAAGRQPGFGVITNIINGGVECGKGQVPSQEGRIGFYKRYCDMLGITCGHNLDCNSQQHF